MRSLVSLAAAVALAGGILIGAQSAQAIPIGFELQENEDGAADLSHQFVVEVLDQGGGFVLFDFRNLGDEASSITDIYFHDMNGDLIPPLTIPVAGQSDGVSFSEGASPGNLPGGANISPPFIATGGLTADSDPAVQPNGINPDEWLLIIAEALDDFESVVAALMSGDLRIGLHVQGLLGGASQTYTSNPTPIPLPAGLLLFLSGLAGVGFLGRYKARRRESAVA
jgi:hypothetical protein